MIPLPRFSRRVWAATVSASLIATGLFIVAAAPASAASRAFTSVFNTNTTGDVMIRGNTLETCPVGSSSSQSSPVSCANVQTGTSVGVNNNFAMTYVDTDSDGNTFDSSSATVTIPTGATVLYAGLSWSATAGAGSLANYPLLSGVNAPNSSAKGTISFKVPNGSYSPVNSAATPDSVGSGYQGFKDVTTAVATAGSGSYTVANVQAGTGGNDYAGWALAIAYRDPTQPVRNLNIYNGFTSISNGASTTIPISGFTTPLSGPVVSRLGAVVYEGDRGNVGDSIALGSNAIANALNTPNDVENSSITDLGVPIIDRNPTYNNTLGIDIDRFDATGFLTNGQTSTTINLKTVGDGYYPALITLATNLYSPLLQTTKSVRDLTNGITGSVQSGDTLAYSMAITNTGGDGSTSSILTDAVPTGATYVANTLTIGGNAVTDASDTDAGDVTGGTVTARLGIGANGTTGGTMATNASVFVTFKVTVNAGDAAGTVIANAATLGYSGATTGKAFIGTSNTVTSTVGVTNVNPVLAFPAPPSGEVSAAYTKTLTASGGTGPYTWVATGTLPTGLLLNPTTGVLSGTPTVSGTYNFTVSATDANNQVATETTSIYIAPLPALSYPSILQNADTNNAYSYALGVSPGTGPYVWSVSAGTLPTGLTLDAATGVISGTPTVAVTSRTFTIRVVDFYGASITQSTSLTVLTGPSLSYAQPPTGEINVPYSAPLAVVGGTSPYLWATTTGTLPAGITQDSGSGLLSGTPTASGTSTVMMTVTDVNGATASESTTITIVPAPTLTGTLSAGETSAPYSSGFTINDGIGPFVWTVSSGPLPTGLSINSTTGLITGTPSVAGSYQVTIQASDSTGTAATRMQTITVSAGPAVAFTAPNGEVGVFYTAQPTASGGTGPYTWAVSTGTLPAGLSINATTGAITGTPSAAGTPTITVQATDANGGTATQARTITIVAAPTLTGTLAGGEASAPYSSGFTVNDGTGPFVWTVSSGTLPAGLSITTSTGLITGTPTATGSSPITVQVTDGNTRTTTRAGTITVTAGPGVTFTPATGEVGVAYTAQPTASGGTGPYTWAVSTGTLPAGLSINVATGAITGTPSAAGTPTITVQATDANGGTGTQARTITIVAAPTLTFTAPPATELGAAYSDQLTKSGGIGPFTWTVSVGSLPAGLTLASDTGLLSGAPTALGTSSFTVRIVDGNGQTAAKDATILVNKTTSTVSVSAPASVRFGNTVVVTAAVGPSSAGGTVTFTDVPTTGPQAGNTTTLGTGTVSSGAASVTTTLPAFGVNTIKASYAGDATHAAATSTTTQVEVSAYAGELIVTEYRTSGPGGAGDNYVELLNTGATVPLAGFTISADSGAVSTLPANAGLLGTGRSYLVTGAGFTLAGTATSDYSVATVGTGGMKVNAPDTAGTQTDAVGPATGFHTGTGLAAITGNPDSQWAWVRNELAGAAVNTSNNAADFQLVSTGFAAVGGVQPTLGSASPTGTADPYQHDATLQSTLLDTGQGAGTAPNRVVVSGTPGQLVIRRTITNTTGQTITTAKVRVSAISEQYGAPEPGVASQPATVAQLRAINPGAATEQVTVTGGASVTVHDLSVDAPNSGGLGGGLNSTFTVPLPGGGLASGASINVAFTFAVVTHGAFWFGYDVDANTTPAAAPGRHRTTNRIADGRLDARHSTTRRTAARVSGHVR